MVAAGDGEYVVDELGGDGHVALVLFVHARVGVAWDGGSDAAGRSTLACGNENEKLHEVVIHIATGRLEDKGVSSRTDSEIFLQSGIE